MSKKICLVLYMYLRLKIHSDIMYTKLILYVVTSFSCVLVAVVTFIKLSCTCAVCLRKITFLIEPKFRNPFLVSGLFTLFTFFLNFTFQWCPLQIDVLNHQELESRYTTTVSMGQLQLCRCYDLCYEI